MAAEHQGPPLTRRQFVLGASLAGLGLLVGCGRLPGQEPGPVKLPRVGYLQVSPMADSAWAIGYFRDGLHEFGYVEGQNIVIERRSAEGSPERLPVLAADLTGLTPDVIVAEGPTINAARSATSTIPIVMVGALDPVRNRQVASLARPGGNVTGTSVIEVDLSAKRLERLKDAIPGLSRVAVFWHGTSIAKTASENLQGVGEALGVQVHPVEIGDSPDFSTAFELAI